MTAHFVCGGHETSLPTTTTTIQQKRTNSICCSSIGNVHFIAAFCVGKGITVEHAPKKEEVQHFSARRALLQEQEQQQPLRV